MPAIKKVEAVERLAQTVAASSPDDFIDIYAELFPNMLRLQVSDAEQWRSKVTEYVRTKMQPEEMVDLWNVVYPDDRHVYYDDANDLLCYNEEISWYA